jgi:hypothetical protein
MSSQGGQWICLQEKREDIQGSNGLVPRQIHGGEGEVGGPLAQWAMVYAVSASLVDADAWNLAGVTLH